MLSCFHAKPDTEMHLACRLVSQGSGHILQLIAASCSPVIALEIADTARTSGNAKLACKLHVTSDWTIRLLPTSRKTHE